MGDAKRSKSLIRYLKIPEALPLPGDFVVTGAGVQFVREGQDPPEDARSQIEFREFFGLLCLGQIPSNTEGEFATESLLVGLLDDCATGDEIELPNSAWEVLNAALPRGLKSNAPSLYKVLREFFGAVTCAPVVRPKDWGTVENKLSDGTGE